MKPIYVSIANVTIEIFFHKNIRLFYTESLIQMVHDYLSPFIIMRPSTKKILWRIIFTKQEPLDIWEIAKTRKNTTKYFRFFYEKRRNTYYVNYNVSIFQLLLLLKKLIEEIFYQNGSGLFLHASSCTFRNHTFLFMGRSGAGKSTIVQLFNYAGGTAMSDDTSIITRMDKRIYYFQAPFVETNYVIKKDMIPRKIRAVFFLKKARENKIKEINGKLYIFKRLSKQPFTRRGLTKGQIKLLTEFVRTHRFYYFSFTDKKDQFKRFVLKPFFNSVDN